MADPSRLDAPDSSLIHRASTGDTEAFALLYRRYQHVAFRFACSMTGSAAAAEDVTQEVFVAVFRDLTKYDAARASFSTYLYGIVRNLSRERLRRERRFLSLSGLPSLGERETYRHDPSDAIEDAQLSAQVRHALNRLPSRYREVVILCDLHSLSYADAAAVVGTTSAAVRSRLHRGRQLLRRYLARVAQPHARRSHTPERCAI